MRIRDRGVAPEGGIVDAGHVVNKRSGKVILQIVDVQRRTVSHAAAVPDAEGIGGFAKQLQCRIHDAALVEFVLVDFGVEILFSQF